MLSLFGSLVPDPGSRLEVLAQHGGCRWTELPAVDSVGKKALGWTQVWLVFTLRASFVSVAPSEPRPELGIRKNPRDRLADFLNSVQVTA